MMLMITVILFNQWEMPSHEGKYLCSMPRPDRVCAESLHSYDVLKYELNASLPMTSRSLSAVNKIKCRSLTNGLNACPFHCRTLVIDSAKVDGLAATYSLAGETLLVDLPQTYDYGDSFSVVIGYHGSWSVTNYQTGFVYYPQYYNSNTLHSLAYTLGEPWDARAWMPCYDEPYDKADQGCVIAVTVPDSCLVCANGELIDIVNNPGGTRTFTYQENYPIATYLMHFGASRYARLSQWCQVAPGDSLEIRHFVWPEDSAQAVVAFQYLPVAVALFDSMYGSFPFDRYGQDVVYPYAWGGMEHQEQTTIHRWWVLNQSENGMAHELSHQWWGDMVTCVDFREIWLNEGFATYSDANYNGMRFGHAEFLNTMQSRASDYFADDANWRHPLYDPPVSELFNWGYTYCKGSWVVHMLRYLGQAQFFSGLAAYRDSFEYGKASTEDLKGIFNQAYGTDLSWFFNEWVYDQGFPVYAVYWYCIPTASNYTAQIRIRQTQVNAPAVFHMPVQVLLHMTTGDTLVNIPITSNAQYAEFVVSDSVTGVEFDPDFWILKQHDIYYGLEENSTAGTGPGADDIFSANPLGEPLLEYYVARAGPVKIAMYDVSGRLVRKIFNGVQGSGRHRIALGQMPDGVYFCRLETPLNTVTKKLVIAR
jgi:aminopeptidase N